jgi:malate dehydrogenase (oxaloacetate-decarboxylating)(NADP+)
MGNIRKDALEYHMLNDKPGKISVVPTKPLDTQYDLGLAYTPGVAEPVLEIDKDPSAAYKYTAKGNLVGVITNGTAILGLGDRGPLASKPVMEGKAVLFKKFADIDVFDIEVDAKSIEEMVSIVKAIAPTFGGINLEDIKAPECFEIERQLEEILDIPVFHDDQHGTAIISAAGLLNALELVDKKLDEITIVVSGAGAAALSCARMAVLLGVRRESITIVDSKGVVYEGRTEGMNPYKAEFATQTDMRSLEEAIQDADVFYGLSIAGLLKPEMVKTMAKDPLIFAMANPDPEINYDDAKEARPDAIIGTGRSDYPNQINNVLGFPFIFRGALDVRASHINDEMKIAAARALALLAREDVPDSVLNAYSLEKLKFGREYIIPKPFDPRVLLNVAPAVAEAAMKSGVARKKIDLETYREQLALRQGKGQQVRQHFLHKAKMNKHNIRMVFPEGEESKIIRAAAQVKDEGFAEPILLGEKEIISKKIADLGLDYQPKIIDSLSSKNIQKYADALYQVRSRNGVTLENARKHLRDKNTFGAMMVKTGDADAMVSGILHEYPEVIRPALQIHHTSPGIHKVAGIYILIIKERVYILSDATVNINPTAEDLSEIAIMASEFAVSLDIEPKVAMLSFSNFGSTPHPESEKVRRAVELAKLKKPKLVIDGEMQADTAIVRDIVEQRFPFSKVSDANVLIFPSLASANIAVKLLGRLSDAHTIGPILLGMGAPIQVLSPGDEVRNIVNIAAVASIEAERRKEHLANRNN